MKTSKIALHWQIMIGLALGILWALLSSSLGWSKFTIDWIDPFGKIFINLLKLIAVPLVLFSVIKGISDLSDTSKLGSMGGKTILTYVITTVIAIFIGLFIANLIQPGNMLSEERRITSRISYELWVNDNPDTEYQDDKRFLTDPTYSKYVAQAKAKLESVGSNVSQKKYETAQKTKDNGPLQFLVDMVPFNMFYAFSNGEGKPAMLQVIFFAVFFGVVLLMIQRDKAGPVINFVDGVNEVFIKMVDVLMRGAPFFVFALLAGIMSRLAGNNPQEVINIFVGLGGYALVVVLGLSVMVFVIYPGLLILLMGKKLGVSPIKAYINFFKGISPAQILAFSTSSSAATLPVTMECVTDRLGVPKKTANFVLPIGATVNMDGTSLYQAVAVLFLAQMHCIDLTIVQQLTIVITATLASIGSAAVPGAGLVMLIIVLQSVNLNPAWVGIILPVDRILDMCRTVVNVTGDAAVATIISELEELEELEIKPESVNEFSS